MTKDEAIEKMENHIEYLEQVLKEVGDMAHDASCGPVCDDVYWDIRRIAYDAYAKNWMDN